MDKWEYINTITNGDNDVEILSCTTDSNGNPIKLKAVAMFIYSAVSSQVTGNANIKFGATPVANGTSSTYEIMTISAGIRTTAQQNMAWARVMGVIPDGRNSTQSPASDKTTTLFVGGSSDSNLSRSGITTTTANDGYIHQAYVQGKYFGPGSFIRVYGIRA